ncbi:MAG TPA: VOC family protein [Ktedonobacteraceae bacterium]|nr:VOC family protein [Ktedonobacteraceae bacterium]
MSKNSYVEICVSNFEQSVQWFENVLGFRAVVLEENEYAELRRGETSIQLAADSAPYWESEHSRLLPAGQRGSGVEIVLVVDDVNAIYRQAQQAHAEIVRELADYPWHMRQFWVRHPDGYLIRPAQRLLTVDPNAYRRQIVSAFREGEERIDQKLLAVKDVADGFARQQDYLSAATLDEMIIKEIFERSHLYESEEEEYDDYYEEEYGHPEEEGLEELVQECIEELAAYLAQEQTDRVAREKIIQVLFGVYRHDLNAGSIGLADRVAEMLVHDTTPMEQHTIADWVRAILAGEAEELTDDEDEDLTSSARQAYGGLLLALESDRLDDEAYLRIARETGRTSDVVDQLLTLGRVDEAVREAEPVGDEALLRLADLFVLRGQDSAAERVVQERIKKTENVRIIEWLKRYYEHRNKPTAALEQAEAIFRKQPYLGNYREVRDLAKQLGRWATLRPELLDFLEKRQNSTLLIQIALDEGNIDKALALVKAEEKPGQGYGATYFYGYGDMRLAVAKAAEEMRPREAIEIYQKFVERQISQKQRKYYQEACSYLVRVRALYEKIGENEKWKSYVAALREKYHTLRALREEMVNAGL